MIYGIDISAWQTVTSWHNVAAVGKKFAHVKASEGTYYRNTANFLDSLKRGNDVGIAMGAYHFFNFGGDPVEQAERFVRFVDWKSCSILPYVDVEDQSMPGALPTVEARVNSLARFIYHVEQSIQAKIMLYVERPTWNEYMNGSDAFSGHKLIVPEYYDITDPSLGAPDLPGGWSDWTIHQYTSSGRIDGIVNSDTGKPINVDFDRLKVDDLSIIRNSF